MSLPGVSDVRSFSDTVSSHSQEPASPSCHLCSSGPLLRTQTSGSLVVYLSLFFSLCPPSLFSPPFSPTSYFSILCLSILDLSFLPFPLSLLSPPSSLSHPSLPTPLPFPSLTLSLFHPLSAHPPVTSWGHSKAPKSLSSSQDLSLNGTGTTISLTAALWDKIFLKKYLFSGVILCS